MSVWASTGDENTFGIGVINAASPECLYVCILVPPHSTTHMGVVPSSSEHDRKAATANTPSTNPLVSCTVRDLMKTIGHLAAGSSVMSMWASCLQLVLNMLHFVKINAFCKAATETLILLSSAKILYQRVCTTLSNSSSLRTGLCGPAGPEFGLGNPIRPGSPIYVDLLSKAVSRQCYLCMTVHTVCVLHCELWFHFLHPCIGHIGPMYTSGSLGRMW